MNELIFNVEFLSDIVLPATSNTEGNVENLDFIPGSNFLGMVASKGNYEKFSDSFKVFHSGDVRFGDATLLVNDEATYKMPLSFFHEKLVPNEMVNHHLIQDFSKFKQLKQKRKGYITKDLEEVSIKHNYAQKSAYNKDERRSQEGSMYGYNAIPSGTLWQFKVAYQGLDEVDVTRIKEALLGKRRLGKSKSSQYGAIDIREGDKAKSVECSVVEELTYVYAKSRLALVDEEGMATYDLKYLIEGLDESQIVWDKTQLKTSTFTPYNGAMQTKSYERLVINSGSVIVLKNLSELQVFELKKGVGVYLSEGFGELILNPSFLAIENKFKFKDKKSSNPKLNIEIHDHMVQFLAQRASKKRRELDLANRVSDFISKNKKLYKGISKAQWGTIRSICTSPIENFKDEIRAYISDGKVTWKTEQIENLLEEAKSREFIKLLSMQMPKLKEEK
ncbi:MAG TPA: hypothetical protein ENK94_02780 [Campylobacterales bacterium]|nr:hypothetical protein [Campylobacterales bacterium]